MHCSGDYWQAWWGLSWKLRERTLCRTARTPCSASYCLPPHNNAKCQYLMTPSSQAETGLDSFIFVAVKTLLWLCYGRTNVILIPSLLFTPSCCWWPRPPTTRGTWQWAGHVMLGPCPVSSDCTRVRCPVTVHVSSVQCPGHVSTHFHWPGSGAGPAHCSIKAAT